MCVCVVLFCFVYVVVMSYMLYVLVWCVFVSLRLVYFMLGVYNCVWCCLVNPSLY